MTFDQHGRLWLSDPWIAAAAVAAVLVVALVCHHWIATERPAWTLAGRAPARRKPWQRTQPGVHPSWHNLRPRLTT